ncbi:MAG TPA: glycosyltransferase [Solirubrobacteraceae bacterium]|nr:glycosyltransferase [Solirubrobacteraceae bacterium]
MIVGHVVHRYGRLSESFIPDALEALERAGAQAWVGTLSVEGRDTYPFPPAERLLVSPPPPLPLRALDRLRGRSGTERFAAAVAERLRPHSPALVHAQFGWAAGSGTAVARRLGVPAVVTFHGTDVTVASPGDATTRAFDRIDMAFAVSRFIEDKLRGLGYAGRVEIVPAGVRLDRLAYRGDEPGDGRILYVGRLNEQKGLSVLLDALPAVDAPLDVIGGGPSRDELEAKARRLGVPATFHGPLPRREDVLAAMRRAAVLVMPSRAMPDGAAEGSPVVTKEAQAVGIPLVATATGGIAETLPPEHRGDLVPGDDPPALAAAIERVLSDPAAAVARARHARAWVEEQFDSERLARRTVALYERL